MTDGPKRRPVLSDSERPVVPERVKRWLAEQEALRARRPVPYMDPNAIPEFGHLPLPQDDDDED